MIPVRNATICLSAVLLAISLSPVSDASELKTDKAVLVTGASSGIGRNIAERLAAEGYFVYAGARKDADIEALGARENMLGLRLDVTIQEDIDAAVETITTKGRGLYAVINNAGVASMGLLADTTETDLDFQFDVNVYGPFRIVQAFAPLLAESKGRIVNISSMAGIMSPPAYGVYSMSKHAIEAFTDTLAAELGTVGISVSAVEPGPFNSRAAAASCKRYRQHNIDPSESLTPELSEQVAAACDDRTTYPEPDPVADVVMHLLTADNTRSRYLAPSDPRQAEFVLRNLMQSVADLSTGLGYGYSREELIGLLDEALAASGR